MDLSRLDQQTTGNEFVNSIISPAARPNYGFKESRLARLEQLTKEKPVTAFAGARNSQKFGKSERR